MGDAGNPISPVTSFFLRFFACFEPNKALADVFNAATAIYLIAIRGVLNGCHLLCLYGFLTPLLRLSSPFLRAKTYALVIVFFSLELGMDILFVGGIAALWGLLALMVWGFKKLEKPEAGRA